MIDPIIGRDISSQCWNSHHEGKNYIPGWGTEHIGCEESSCGCLCHPRNQVEAVPEIPVLDAECTYCLDLREVPANSTTYIPCPKCCSAVSSEKETV